MKKIESNTAHPLGEEEPSREEPGAKIAVSVVIPVYNTPE